ncbi:type II toxin-antitoxin system HipA family toxin [Sphaerisporangium rhizosphaerae]|uniref:Type II toxin-antitoxin system HipA family toxin n=1 Tax=Sphaerisporangium rhizosphaerae TaxID=2269375 RepID=A0ABW2P4M5_9ACTN
MSSDAALAIQLQRPDGSWVDVGWLERRDQTNWFSFSEQYWRVRDRPVLGQAFEESGFRWKSQSTVALPRWFSHLLPEGRLREAVAKAAQVNVAREFELISRLGLSDLPGGIRAFAVQDREVTIVPSKDEGDEGASNPLLKFSLDGAQLKFSLYGNKKGLTVPVKGQAGNFIVKFPDNRPGFDGVPETEAASLCLAKAIGISTPEFFLIDPSTIDGLEEWAPKGGAGQALAVRRFDRLTEQRRVHMEELAQVLDIPTANHNAKYDKANFEVVAVVIGGIVEVSAVGEVVDRIVLNVLLGNGDAHLKNWAFIYPDGRNPKLSPVYDILPTVLFFPADDLGMNLGKTKKFSLITPSHFEELGRRSGFGASEASDRARLAVEKIMAHWSIMKEYLPKDRFYALDKRLKQLSLVRFK